MLNQEPMTCEQVHTYLMPYLKGSLMPTQRRRFKAHLQTCGKCAQQVRDAEMMENLLYQEMYLHRPTLSTQASVRIQENVYRKIRRSLVWQRTGQMVRMGTAVMAACVLLIVGVWFGQFWLPALTGQEVTQVQPGSEELVSVTESPEASAQLSDQPVLARPEIYAAPDLENDFDNVLETDALETAVSLGTVARVSFGQSLKSSTPGADPGIIAQRIVQASLVQDEAMLQNLLVGTSSLQDPSARLWLLFGQRCANTLYGSSGLRYETVPIPLPYISTVRLYHQGEIVGDIKFRQFNGDWYATFTVPPHINRCLQDNLRR